MSNFPINATDSFYMKRLKDCMKGYSYEKLKVGNVETGRYIGHVRSKFIDTCAIIECADFKLEEFEYKGFQVITANLTQKVTRALDLSGNTLNGYPEDLITDKSKYIFEEPFDHTQSWAWAYRIGAPTDSIAQIGWVGMCAVFAQSCISDSIDKTIKNAKKTLDKYSLAYDQLATLNVIANDNCYYREGVTPFNIKLNDKVFINAFGRMRRGIVVGFEGRRFVVAYTTPTTPADPKYKILNLQDIQIKEKEIVVGQEHNFTQSKLNELLQVTSTQP